MAAWSDFLPGVLQYASGCPDPVAEDQVRKAARRLCEKAAVWVGDLAAVNVWAGVAEYDLVAAEDGAWVVRPTHLACKGGPLRLEIEARMDAECPGWRGATGTACRYLLPRPGVARLYPVPIADAALALTGRAQLKPSATAEECPDALLEAWEEVICDGALEKLLAMPRREWSDPAGAMLKARDFRRGLGQALVKTIKGGGSGNVLLSPPPPLGG